MANPGGPYSAKVNSSITFDGSKSSDPDGIVKDYVWDFGNGKTATGQKPSYTYTKAGTYTVKLVVKDELGIESATVTTTATITADESSHIKQIQVLLPTAPVLSVILKSAQAACKSFCKQRFFQSIQSRAACSALH